MFCGSSFNKQVLYAVSQIDHQHNHSEYWWKGGINDPRIHYHDVGPKGWRWWPQPLKIVQQVEHTGCHIPNSHQVDFLWSNRVKSLNNQ